MLQGLHNVCYLPTPLRDPDRLLQISLGHTVLSSGIGLNGDMV